MQKIIVLVISCVLSSASYGQDAPIELYAAGLANVFEYRIPSLISTPKGSLIALVDARKDRRGDIPNNVDLAIRRSLDGGKTWDEIQIIVDYETPESYDVSWGVADAAMAYDHKNSALWCLYTVGQGVGIRQSQPGLDGHTCQIHAIYSKDEGKSWSKPHNISPQCKLPQMKFFGTAPGRGIQTKDGDLVFCIYTTEEGNGNVMTPYLIVSKDFGNSWSLSETWADKKTSVTETQIVELPDGTWMVNSRNHYGKQRRLIATSKDKGKTWSDISFDDELPCPTCMASLISIPHPKKKKKQLLVFANPANEKERKDGTIRISDDNGKTWLWSKLVKPGPYGYSCLTQLSNGDIGLFYEGGSSKLYFTSLSIAHLTKGKISSK